MIETFEKFIGVQNSGAFIVFLRFNHCKCEEMLGQGIFVCENETDNMTETRSTILTKYPEIKYSDAATSKNVKQGVQEYFENV